MKKNTLKLKHLLAIGSILIAPFVWSSENVLELSLEEAISLSLAKNYFVQYQRIVPEIAEQRVEKEKADFDPNLSLNYGVTGTDRLQSGSSDLFSETDSDSASLSLSGKISLGTSYRLSVSSVSDDSLYASDQQKSLSNASRATIQVTQPLLRGFGSRENKASFHISEKQQEIENWRFHAMLMDTVEAVVHTYADLYFAIQNLEVAQNNQALAGKLLEDNRMRVELGKSAESDMILAESRFASRQDAVLRAKSLLHQQTNRFKLLISDQIDGLLDFDVKIQSLDEASVKQMDVAHDFEVALNHRPDFQQVVLGGDISSIALERDRNRVKPQLNWVNRYSSVGGGDDFRSGLNSMAENSAEEYYSGLEFSMPLFNRNDRSQEMISSLQSKQSAINLERYKQMILVQIDNASFRVQSDWERMLASSKARELVEQSLRAEEKKLRAGKSTSFVVLDLQERLANAQVQEIRTKIDYFKSLVSYEREKGLILQRYGVQSVH